MLNKFSFVFIFVLFVCRYTYGQVYPYWYLNQGEIDSEDNSVGVARLGFYVDSSFAIAKKEAIMNYIRYKETKISGGQAFWNTEAGKYFISNRFREEFDTLKALSLINDFKTVDSIICKDFVAVLVSKNENIKISLTDRISVDSFEKPLWVNKLPEDENYYYDIGCSQFYFYELSSWLTAEKQGRFGIAKQLGVNIKSLQKLDDFEGQEIQDEDYCVVVKNMELIGRYKDNYNKIFYVLFRAPIKQ